MIGRDVADVSRVVTIDRGTGDGLAVGDVVVGQGGALAGRITQIGAHAARVVLINEPGSTVIGEVVSNRATGEVVGDLGGQLVMDKVDATQRITIGDEVVTAGITLGSGIRSPYPKGLVIGQVIDATRDPNAVIQTAYLEPAIDLDRLEVVLVITDYQGGIPDATDLPTDQVNPDGTLPGSEQPFATAAPNAARRRSAPRRPRRRARLHEGPDPCRRHGHPALPAHDRDEQAPPADLRPADDLLPDRDPGRDGHPRGDGDRRREERRRRRGAPRRRRALRAPPHLPLPARRAGDRPRHRAGPGLRRRRRVLLRPRRQHPPGAALAPVAREFEAGPWGAGTLLYQVPDPERFGVAELDADGRVVGFEEKPAVPKSDLIPIGVYFLRPDAFGVIDRLAPSGRGEFEITDVLNHYIPGGGLFARRFDGHWADAGTVASLLRAAELASAADDAGELAAPPPRPLA